MPAATPTSSAAAPARPASSARLSRSAPPSTSPITASASSATLSKCSRAARDPSTKATFSVAAAPFGTANKVIPLSVRAAVTIMSADGALDHELLVAVEDETVALPLGLQRDRVGVVARTLVNRQREDRLARQDARIPGVGLRGAFDRPAPRPPADQERGGGEVAPDLFEDQRRLGRAEPEPAMAFGDRDRAEAQFAELGPQIVAEPIGAAARAQRPQLLGRPAFFGEERRGGLLQHLLVVG